MASPITIGLDKGLDLSSPVLAKEPGTLIGCFNYEYTATNGTSRLTGYERYDGWANGGLTDIWTAGITITDAAAFSAVAVGDIVKLSTNLGIINVGVYVSHTANTLSYLPIVKEQTTLRVGDLLIVDSGSSSDATVTSVSLPEHTQLSTSDYISLSRSVSATLRASVDSSPTPVCGLHWFRNNLLEARNAPSYTITGVASSFTDVGEIVQIGTIKGLVIAKTSSPFKLWIEPYVHGTASTSLAVLNKDGTSASTATATTVTEDTGDSDWAYLVGLHTIETSREKGDIRLYRSVFVTFDNGTQAAGADPAVGDIVNVGPAVLTNSYRLIIKSIVLTGGGWAAGDAAGRMELVPLNPLDPAGAGISGPGPYNKIVVGDTVRIDGNSIFIVDSIIRTNIAGTNKLRVNSSHYVGITANFIGGEADSEAYIATGASRAFWARCYNPPATGYVPPPDVLELGVERYYSYGNIIANPELEAVDIPKWVSRHGRLSLALGYAGGTVNVSVVNEPYNMSGLDGAVSHIVGDEITGMLEGVGDSTLVFGRRSICRIVGIGDTAGLQTISPESGAMPYTCVNVGRVPTFVDQFGISTIEQSDTYSDFYGSRVSDAVQSELQPRVVATPFDTEIGGVHCAMPVRGKNQYRVFLRSGDVYSVCMAGNKPIIAVSNYSNDNVARLPLAWSSQIQDNGQERLHVVWDEFYAKYSPSEVDGDYNPVDPNIVYELDSGWGFDGATFTHYVEMAHLFNDGASNFIGVEGIRLFGKSHGKASLVARIKGVEKDFDQAYTGAYQDISLPYTEPPHYYRRPKDVTNFVDHASWGLGVSVRIEGVDDKGLPTVEPPHILQVIVLYVRPEGVTDG